MQASIYLLSHLSHFYKLLHRLTQTQMTLASSYHGRNVISNNEPAITKMSPLLSNLL